MKSSRAEIHHCLIVFPTHAGHSWVGQGGMLGFEAATHVFH
ncbi:MAG TPA: hypothetical protein VHS96_14915 [Bacteroidia bacterium]|nr:hypothetical protein [Bacteroidia bacterium]